MIKTETFYHFFIKKSSNICYKKVIALYTENKFGLAIITVIAVLGIHSYICFKTKNNPINMNQSTLLTIDELLNKLDEQKHIHLDVTAKMIHADNAKIFPLDLMGISVSKRSMSLIKGFSEMIRQENFICAAPMLRMQLDNSLRFYAAFLVENPHELARKFAEGQSIRNFKEKGTNQKLTDRLLVERLSEHYPWVFKVYNKMSGYIHLSDLHLFNTLNKKDDNSNLRAIISDTDTNISEHIRIEAVYIMFELTTIVLWLLNSWTLTKDTPNVEGCIAKHGAGTGYKK